MAEVLVQFDTAVADADGRRHVARVCGGRMENGLWEGWIEFDPENETPVLRTPRETTQPNREDLEYWASGLSEAYLEGALERARHPRAPGPRRTVEAHPAYEGPAPAVEEGGGGAEAGPTSSKTLLDPFAVYAQGEDVLHDELSALHEDRLRDIVRAHDLVGEDELDLQALHRTALVELIVAAVRRRAG